MVPSHTLLIRVFTLLKIQSELEVIFMISMNSLSDSFLPLYIRNWQLWTRCKKLGQNHDPLVMAPSASLNSHCRYKICQIWYFNVRLYPLCLNVNSCNILIVSFFFLDRYSNVGNLQCGKAAISCHQQSRCGSKGLCLCNYLPSPSGAVHCVNSFRWRRCLGLELPLCYSISNLKMVYPILVN